MKRLIGTQQVVSDKHFEVYSVVAILGKASQSTSMTSSITFVQSTFNGWKLHFSKAADA